MAGQPWTESAFEQIPPTVVYTFATDAVSPTSRTRPSNIYAARSFTFMVPGGPRTWKIWWGRTDRGIGDQVTGPDRERLAVMRITDFDLDLPLLRVVNDLNAKSAMAVTQREFRCPVPVLKVPVSAEHPTGLTGSAPLVLAPAQPGRRSLYTE